MQKLLFSNLHGIIYFNSKKIQYLYTNNTDNINNLFSLHEVSKVSRVSK